MYGLSRIKLLTLALILGIGAVVLVSTSLSVVTAAGEVDLTLDLEAPSHVATDSTFEVRIAYYNQGTELPPDAWVTATLPTGTQFITATDRWGAALPPTGVDGNQLGWYFVQPICQKPLDACCGHILIYLQTDENLSLGTALTTTAMVATTAVESDTTNNELSIVSVIGAMAGSTKQVQARNVMPGDVATYTITIDPAQIGGGENGRWVSLTDTLPFSRHVRFLGWRGTLTGTQVESQTLRWAGQVRAGEPLTLQYRLGVEGVVTPGTVLTNVAMLGWAGHRLRMGPVTTVVTMPHGAMALGPYQGGQLRHAYGVTLTVPPGAVSDTVRFQVGPLLTDTHPITPPGGLLFANRAFEMAAYRFGGQVRQFNRPLTITVGYSDTDVSGLTRETLRLWTRSGPEEAWKQLGEPVRVMSGALSFTTTHFSQFALFGEGKPPTGGGDLVIDVKAPTHVSTDATYIANAMYANVGGRAADDNWVTAMLPENTQFVTATDELGQPLPPDEVDGSELTWSVPTLPAKSCWHHILIALQPDSDLAEGTALTITVAITSTTPESDTLNNEASAVSLVSAMAGSAKQVQARNAMPGDVLTYTITVNPAQIGGGENGRWVSLTDTLPFSRHVRFLGWRGTLTGTQVESQTLRWAGQVRAGEPLTLQYRLGVEGVVTPGTVLTNVAMLGWAGHRLRMGPVTTVVTMPHGAMALGPYQGGQLRHAYGVTLTVPPGAVSDTVRFQVGPLLTDTHPITPPGGLLFANRAFEMAAYRFGGQVRQFNRPLTITVGYSDTDVSGLTRETLRLWTRSGPEEAWKQLGEPVRVMSGALSFTTTHFSQFALFGESQYRVYLPLVVR